MAFVSFSQNLEDVMLRRALRDVQTGFYVDVGANDPTADSVTKAFYDIGWHGINIEPIQRHWLDLCRERPHDINLAVAAGNMRHTVEIFDSEIRGWSTLDEEVRQELEKKGVGGISCRVEMRTLSDIFDEYRIGLVHFLKIDVEGFEKAVLEGMDFGKYRPWIVVVEATSPIHQEEFYKEWEPLLTKANYKFAYFDGLNRFYISKEHGKLKQAFRSPPNTFDDYTRYDMAEAKWHFQIASESLESTRKQLGDAENELASCRQATEAMRIELEIKRQELERIRAELQTQCRELLAAQVELEVKGHELATTLLQIQMRSQELETNRMELELRRHELGAAREELNERSRTIEGARAELDVKRGELETVREELKERCHELEAARVETAKLYASKSWKLTAPLRRIFFLLKMALKSFRRLFKSLY